MLISFLQFLANLIIAGVLIRLIEAKYGTTWLGRSLTVIY